MKRALIAVMLATPILSGCARDNPDNVPLRGQWEHTITLDSVTIDGMLFAAEDLPTSFLEMQGTRSQCGEPLYTDASWQADDIADRTGGKCEIDDYSFDDFAATFTGQCVIDERGGNYTPKLRGRSTFTQDETRDVITMEGSLDLPGEGPHVLKMIAVQEGVRVGDC